MEQEHFKIKL